MSGVFASAVLTCDNGGDPDGATNTNRGLTHPLDLDEPEGSMKPIGTCAIEGCQAERIQARGMCSRHYYRVKTFGDPHTDGRKRRPEGCAVDGCDRPNYCREWCLVHYNRWRTHGDPLKFVNHRRSGICELETCDKPSPGMQYCPMHLERLKRNGNFELQDRTRHFHVNGYVRIKREGHRLAQQDGWVYEHRVVLFEKIGPGDHPCHWCGTVVTWERTYPEHADGLVVDHIDEEPANNDPANLVPSCSVCNFQRSSRWAKRAKRDTA